MKVNMLNLMLIEKSYVVDVMVKEVKKLILVVLVKVKVSLLDLYKWDLVCIVKVKVIVKIVKVEVKLLTLNLYVKNVMVNN